MQNERTPEFKREVATYAAEHGSYKAHQKWPDVPAKTARTWRKKYIGVFDSHQRLVGDPRAEDDVFVAGADGARAPRDRTTDNTEVKSPESVEHDQTTNAWSITMQSKTVQTFEELVVECKIDLDIWERERFKCKSYQSTIVPRATRARASDKWIRPSSEPITVQMYAITAVLKRKTPVIDARSEIADLVAKAKTHVTRLPLIYVRPPETGYMLEIALPDLHFGRLSWGRETGGANYDLAIAVQTCHTAIETLLARSAHIRFERVLFVVGNDLLNSDSHEGKTTRGTPQANDGRHFKVFQKARETKVEIIERLVREIAPVDVVVIPGNHDRESTLHLGDSLSCWFHAEKHVNVDVEPTERKYYGFGVNMIGITHGDKGKPMLWSRLMPVEAKALWGKSIYREVHAGHYHHDSAVRDELNGVKVRHLSSLAAPSAWEAGEGHVDSTASAEAFWWHAEDGVVGTAVHNAKY